MIGIFDSGIGGLTVVKELIKELPTFDFVYFGDTARTPYGNKSNETIERYAREDVDFLLKQGAKLIIVACNSASTMFINGLKKEYDVPIFEVITPAVEEAVRISKNKKVGVIGTRATVNNNVYEQLIKLQDGKMQVHHQACPLLVPLVEENWIAKPETRMILRKYLAPLKQKQIDTLILACTHYPLLREIIKHKAGSRVKLVDPAQATINKVKRYIADSKINLPQNSKRQYFVSDLTPHFRTVAERWLKEKVELKKI